MTPSNRCLLIAVTGALVALVAAPDVRADALREVERTTASQSEPRRVHAADAPARPHRSGRRHRETVDEADEDDGAEDCAASSSVGCGAARAVAWMFILPWFVPRIFDDPTLDYFAPYPFADGPALLRSGAEAAANPLVQRVGLDVETESGFMREGVVPASVALRTRLPKRFELSFRVGLLSDLEAPAVTRVAAATGHVLYRHAQLRRVEFRSGIGARFMMGSEPRAGVDFFYGIDGYFARRGVLRIALSAGSLGHAFVGEARATLGAMVGRFELYAGYDHTAFIGRGRTTLSGPIAGVRAFF